MRIERRSNGWVIVLDDGAEITGFSSSSAASVAADALANQQALTAAAPITPAASTSGTPAAGGETRDADAIIAAITASSVEVPARPPREWFDNPGFTAATTLPAPGCTDVRGCPITVEDTGRVYGHVALWNTCHNGEPRGPGICVPPPRSTPDYHEFRRGGVLTASGERIATGPITVGTGHANLGLDRGGALAHYDNSGTIVADVTAGEDEYGIWVAGTVRPGATVAQVEALRRTPLSGDWRDKDGRHELVAVLAVPTPGFSIPQMGLAASAGPARANITDDGRVTALVAAGSQILAAIQAAPWVGEMERLRAELEEMHRAVAPIVAAHQMSRLEGAFS